MRVFNFLLRRFLNPSETDTDPIGSEIISGSVMTVQVGSGSEITIINLDPVSQKKKIANNLNIYVNGRIFQPSEQTFYEKFKKMS